MNYTALKAAVQDRTQLATTDPEYAAIGDRINEALHLIETASPGGWDWLRDEITLPITANTATYTFSTIGAVPAPDVGIVRVNYVEVLIGSTRVPIDRLPVEEARLNYLVSTSSSPDYYSIDRQTLIFWPTPDANGTAYVGVLKTEPDLSAGSDTPLLPSIYHRILVAQASGLVLRALGRLPQAQIEEASADRGLKQMMAYARPAGGPGIIRRRSRW